MLQLAHNGSQELCSDDFSRRIASNGLYVLQASSARAALTRYEVVTPDPRTTATGSLHRFVTRALHDTSARHPGQQVLETEVKQLLHAFRMAAYNVMMMLVREIRVNTTYAAKATKAHDLVRQLFTASADIDPRQDGYLDVVFDPRPTGRQTKVLAELCEVLAAVGTVFPGTDRVLRYRVKTGKVSG